PRGVVVGGSGDQAGPEAPDITEPADPGPPAMVVAQPHGARPAGVAGVGAVVRSARSAYSVQVYSPGPSGRNLTRSERGGTAVGREAGEPGTRAATRARSA